MKACKKMLKIIINVKNNNDNLKKNVHNTGCEFCFTLTHGKK